MFHRTIVAALIAAGLLVSWEVPQAAAEPLYPVLECYEETGGGDVRLHFGVTSLLTVSATPAINDFMIGVQSIAAPSTFEPGYSPRVFSVTVPTTPEAVTWALGQLDFVLFVDPSSLSADDRCSSEAGVAGPTGPTGLTGPTGPQGPTGPAGESAGESLTQCQIVTASLPPGADFGRELTITCGPDEVLVQGGGSCDRGNMRGSFQVDAVSWRVQCRSPKGIQGSALCCPTN